MAHSRISEYNIFGEKWQGERGSEKVTYVCLTGSVCMNNAVYIACTFSRHSTGEKYI